MAHINAGTIQQGGTQNVIQVIGTSIEEGKPLAQCSIDELREERRWRLRLLDKEVRKALVLILQLIVWLLAGGGSTYLSFMGNGALHWLTVLLAMGGVLAPAAILYGLAQRGESEFARRQRQTLKEIAYLLREKGDE